MMSTHSSTTHSFILISSVQETLPKKREQILFLLCQILSPYRGLKISCTMTLDTSYDLLP